MALPTLLLLTDEFPPAIRGGIASWCRNFSISLASNGFKIQIFLPVKNTSPEINNFHSNINFTFIKGHEWNKFRWLYMLIAVTKWLLSNPGGIILATTWQHVSGLVYLKKILRTRIICFAHGTDITRAVSSSRIQSFRRTLPRVDLFIPVSKFLAEKVKYSCTFQTTVKILSNGVDCNHFKPLSELTKSRRELGFPSETPVIVSIGRLVPVKGFDILLRAIAIVKRSHPAIKCYIVGGDSGSEYERLLQLSRDLEIKNSIQFINMIGYDKLPVLYDASDICVLSSFPVYKPYYEEENLPMTLIEASACGKPLIGSRCGGIPEVIADNESGILFMPGDFEALAAAISKLLKNPDLSFQLGINARRRAEQLFNLNLISSNFIELIKNLSQNKI